MTPLVCLPWNFFPPEATAADKVYSQQQFVVVTVGSPMAQVHSQGSCYVLTFKVLSRIKFKRRNNGAVNVKQCTWKWILVSSCWRTAKESWAAAAEHSLGSERGRQNESFSSWREVEGQLQKLERTWCFMQRLWDVQLFHSLWNVPFLMNIPLFTVSPPEGLAVPHHRILSSTLQSLTCYRFLSQLKLWNDCL